MITRQNITLINNKDNTTTAIWEQIISGLNEEGNKYVENFTDNEFNEEISTLERMLNHYLEKREMLKL